MSEERHEDRHRDVENKLNLNGKDDINGNTSISIEVPDGGYGWFILLAFYSVQLFYLGGKFWLCYLFSALFRE
ncbi:AEL_HP2_G0050240.mRNA.1.CDS.1 [Saccharomyces cerevisiae]|nr:AEL_HP2_G0050240.mRNA.1.CDS.1 [Saccharomyces cerevisiae]CAI6796617.1 AEL_HP2_G0050240.mRNA.1.CDS.1 [Saccharomyces cerevisiae]